MTNRQHIMDFLSANRELFRERYQVTRIGLFGSYSRDEAGPDSDIDIILEFEENTPDIYERKRELAAYIGSAFGSDVDIAREKYLKPRKRESILKETLYVG